ncbi:hypothetical protein CRE_04393 [Caenorhabditis remanei]|uniref:Uncharacterized protein n=1 Tax=Caenorhabditis remanei TaxID=31234 RepID=E3NLI5_CAERE|nr:hypothetical protein CRE_04393 [Caenorhabditis remanei]
MRIDEVQLTPTMIRINKKTYRLCLYECYRESPDKMPEGIRNVRKMSRERDHDVDHYGIRDQPEAIIRFIERYRQDLDIEHSKDMYYKAKQLLSIEKNPVEMKALEERINHYGSIYYPYLLREEETPRYRMPYFYCIKLVVGDDKTEAVEYSKTLGDTLKYMVGQLFGSAKSIAIRVLEINPTAPFHYSMPYNLSVCNLKITEQAEKALDAFNFSSPLQKLEIMTHSHEIFDFRNRIIRKTAIYSNPVVRDTEVLIVNGVFFPEDLQQIPNRRVLFSKPHRESTMRRVLPEMVNMWRRDTPVIGTHFEFNMEEHFWDESFFDNLEYLPGARKGRLPETRYMRSQRCVDFELDNESEVTVFYYGNHVHLVVHRK